MRKSKVKKSLFALLLAACIVLIGGVISFFSSISVYYIVGVFVVPLLFILKKDTDTFLTVLFTALFAIGMCEVPYFVPILLSLVMLLIPLYVYMRGGKTFSETLFTLGFTGKPIRAFVFALLSMIPAIFLVFLLSQIAYHLGFNDAQKVDQKITELPFYILLYAITVGPIAEEVFFRSFLSKHIGYLPANLLFAFAHFSYGSVYEIVGAFGLGIFLYLLFKFSGDIKSSIFAHMLINAGSIYMIKYASI